MKRYEKAMAIAIISILIVGLLTVMVLLMGIVAKAEFVVAESGLRVRKEPNLDAEVIKVVPFGEQVEGPIINGWMETEDGYLSAEFLSETDPLAEAQFLGPFLLTAYTHSGFCCADGSYPEAGYTIACNSLPMGTRVFISGIGFRTVCDRGPASMPDAWLDLFVDGYSEAVAFGEQRHDVWITKTP